MDSTLAYAEFSCGGAHGSLIFDYVASEDYSSLFGLRFQ